MTIFDYTITDLMFAHWFKRKREILPEGKPAGIWRGNAHPEPNLWLKAIDGELDRLRPLRNQNCSIFVLDTEPLSSV